MSNVLEKNKYFYDNFVSKMIHEKFGEYENRIAVGIAGEGSDCLGYDDELSRDHDFGTGVCLWLTDEDMEKFGQHLSFEYNQLVDSVERSYYTDRLRERRGVMTIHDFYSNILHIDCDVKNCIITESDWFRLDHTCLKTATNGIVFRDELGVFTKFRHILLSYYPDRIWKWRIADKLHEYAMSLQVNYARCMTRRDIVAAQLCRAHGLQAAMDLFFLLYREYAPYYKWTYRGLKELDKDGIFAEKIVILAEEPIRPDAWDGTAYHPNRLNYKDGIVCVCEEIASEIEEMLLQHHLIQERRQFLETHVRDMLVSCGLE